MQWPKPLSRMLKNTLRLSKSIQYSAEILHSRIPYSSALQSIDPLDSGTDRRSGYTIRALYF